MAARRGLRTLLQLGMEGLDDFIFLLQLFRQSTCAHKEDNQLQHSDLMVSALHQWCND